MDVVEISLQSGMKYAKDKVDLRALEEAGVTKVEEEQGKVTLYFEVYLLYDNIFHTLVHTSLNSECNFSYRYS